MIADGHMVREIGAWFTTPDYFMVLTHSMTD
jgi:hypothetical protein